MGTVTVNVYDKDNKSLGVGKFRLHDGRLLLSTIATKLSVEELCFSEDDAAVDVDKDGFTLQLFQPDTTVSFIGTRAAAASTPSGVSDYLQIFMDKIKRYSAHTKPREDVIKKIALHHTNQLQVAVQPSTPDGVAFDLYELVRDMPQTSTKAKVQDATGITINGPLSDNCAYLLSAWREGGGPCVVKVLQTSEACQKVMTDIEQSAITELGLGPAVKEHNLVPCQAIIVNIPSEETHLRIGRGDFNAVVMPYYIYSLDKIPSVPLHVFAAGAQQILRALNYIHGMDYVHMDVKAQNVMVDAEGKWFLGDFGTTIRTGTTVHHSTFQFYPDNTLHKPARREYDYGMLATMLAMLVVKDKPKGVEDLKQSDNTHVDGNKVRKVLMAAESAGAFNDFATSLLAMCDQEHFPE